MAVYIILPGAGGLRSALKISSLYSVSYMESPHTLRELHVRALPRSSSRTADFGPYGTT